MNAPFSQNSEHIDKSYKYWRLRIFYSTYIGYALFYFSRKSFTFTMPALMDDLNYSAADLGFLGSMLYCTYGISKFVSGVQSDRSNPRYFMAAGLFLTGLCNIFFGMSSSLWCFAAFWALNGWFQGWGWPPVTKLLNYWFSHDERGKVWSFNSTSHNVGGGLIPLVVAGCIFYFSWRTAMVIPGLICIIASFWLVNRLRNIPETLGLPPVEEYKGYQVASRTTEPLSVKKILFDNVLRNKYVWVMAVSYFLVYIVRTGVNDWGSLFLIKHKSYTLTDTAPVITMFEIGGFLGSIAAGWGSDAFFTGRRVPAIILCAIGLGVTLPLFWLLPAGYPILDSVLMAALGFFIFGPQMLVGLAAAEFVDKKAACSANGFVGCFAYLGAAFSGYPLGLLIDHYSWAGFFLALGFCVVVLLLVSMPLWSARSYAETRAQETAIQAA